MYTLKITDENTVVTTVKESIVERSNYVDKIQIVTSKMYRELLLLDVLNKNLQHNSTKQQVLNMLYMILITIPPL